MHVASRTHPGFNKGADGGCVGVGGGAVCGQSHGEVGLPPGSDL